MSTSNFITELVEDQFDLVLNSKLPVWVTYGASWCPPCKAFAPTHEQVAQQFAGKVASFHVDVDEAPGLASNASIRSVPTHVCYKDGKEIKRLQGAIPKSQAESIYSQLLQ